MISPSSVRTDRIEKRDYFVSAGVPDYWVVDLDARIVERWTPGNRTPAVVRSTLEWHPDGANAPLVIDVANLFERVWTQFRRVAPRGK